MFAGKQTETLGLSSGAGRPLVVACVVIALVGALLVSAASVKGAVPALQIVAATAVVLAALEDAVRFKLRDAYTLLIALTGFAAACFQAMLEIALSGALLGFAILWLAGAWFERRNGYAGIGWGDYKLAAGLGAWAGPECVGPIIVAAAVGALTFASARKLLGRPVWFWPSPYRIDDALPFGTFLGLVGLLFAAVGLSFPLSAG